MDNFMRRILIATFFYALTVFSVQAHFIWIVPEEGQPTNVKIIFSENLIADQSVPIDKIANTKLMYRNSNGKIINLEFEKSKDALLTKIPNLKNSLNLKNSIVAGTCNYGVMQYGKGKPFLLAYYPKLIQGELESKSFSSELRLEIIPRDQETFQVLFAGKPTMNAEVVVVQKPIKSEKETLNTDANGMFKLSSTVPGQYGIRARYIETKSGEQNGKKYEEVRHYATLVYQLVEQGTKKDTEQKGKNATNTSTNFAPLPRGVSSFGAAVAGDWVYVYGGHCGKTHSYSTEDVLGSFHRLNLKEGKNWEELSSGPIAQGLAMVSYQGKIYRIGGMQPQNKPGEKANNLSLKTCSIFDPSTKKWEDLPDLPEGRSSHDAVIVKDKLYVVGGWKTTGNIAKPDWLDSMLMLDLTQKPLKWESIKQPFQRRALTASSLNNKIYIIGGLTPKADLSLEVNIYDPANSKWSTGPSIPEPNSNGFTPASCTLGNRLYVSTADGKIYRLSVKGNAWESVGSLQQPRFVHRIVPTPQGMLLAIGGASRTGNVALTEAIKP